MVTASGFIKKNERNSKRCRVPKAMYREFVDRDLFRQDRHEQLISKRVAKKYGGVDEASL